MAASQYYKATAYVGTPHRNAVNVTIPLVGPAGPQGPAGEAGAGAVESVNGQTGVVVLAAADVGAVASNDARLTDARTPTSHTHGNITNAGAIGTTANLPVKTGTSGVLEAGAFGTAAGQFAEGNHTHAAADITSGVLDFDRIQQVLEVESDGTEGTPTEVDLTTNIVGGNLHALVLILGASATTATKVILPALGAAATGKVTVRVNEFEDPSDDFVQIVLDDDTAIFPASGYTEMDPDEEFTFRWNNGRWDMDLRPNPSATTAVSILKPNASGTLGLSEPSDSTFRIVGSSDATKKVAFEVDGLTAATTRTLTVPNASGTLALTSDFAAPPAIGNTTPNTLAGTQLALHDGSDTGTFVAASKLTANRTYDLPDASGTIALTAQLTDTQIFTANGTWTKPAGAKNVHYTVIGGGGGGGSGRIAATGTDRGGGGGGSGAGITLGWINPSTLGATETITVGSGGAGGASNTASTDADGNAGSAGGNSSIGTLVIAVGGNAGQGGVGSGTANGGAGTGNSSMLYGTLTTLFAGGASPATSAAQPGLRGSAMPAGGGGGGRITSGGAGGLGGTGGIVGSTTLGQVLGGASAVPSNNGLPGATAYNFVGSGGSGGASTSAGFKGGAGGDYGGGGAGGSGATNGQGGDNSGGNGGAGIVVITTYF